jgi:hypothetical protein
MAKWNWLQGLRYCVAGAAVALVSSVAVAGDATSIPDTAVANPDKVFQQTSYKLYDASCEAPAAKCGTNGACGSKDGACGTNCGCRSDGCDGGLAGMLGMGDCSGCSGDPWKLNAHEGVEFGGWAQFGYSSAPTAFNNGAQDRRLLLNQGWLFADRAATSECGEWGWGYHADFVYGADGANTNSFGNNAGQFDLHPSFAHGDRADWAIPQLYAEVTNGDWTVKAGHFYTLHGYEVVQATGNFFFTHAYTMNYAEPFTHTGFIVTKQLSDDTEVYGGWTAGFDTGFDQRNGGSNFMGGYSTALSDCTQLTQIVSFGDFGAGFAPPIVPAALNEDGSIALSTVIDHQISDKLNYVFHSDVLRTGVYDTFGVNQYLIYQVSDCVAAGARLEWWKSDGRSVNAMTVGVNVKPHANVTVRPEYRYDWSPAGNTNAGINSSTGRVDQSHGTFAVDVILTF